MAERMAGVQVAILSLLRPDMLDLEQSRAVVSEIVVSTLHPGVRSEIKSCAIGADCQRWAGDSRGLFGDFRLLGYGGGGFGWRLSRDRVFWGVRRGWGFFWCIWRLF